MLCWTLIALPALATAAWLYGYRAGQWKQYHRNLDWLAERLPDFLHAHGPSAPKPGDKPHD